jgi:hypothetical protein
MGSCSAERFGILRVTIIETQKYMSTVIKADTKKSAKAKYQLHLDNCHSLIQSNIDVQQV